MSEASDDPGWVFYTEGGVDLADPVEGNDWLTWGRWVEKRLAEALEFPETAWLAQAGDVADHVLATEEVRA